MSGEILLVYPADCGDAPIQIDTSKFELVGNAILFPDDEETFPGFRIEDLYRYDENRWLLIRDGKASQAEEERSRRYFEYLSDAEACEWCTINKVAIPIDIARKRPGAVLEPVQGTGQQPSPIPDFGAPPYCSGRWTREILDALRRAADGDAPPQGCSQKRQGRLLRREVAAWISAAGDSRVSPHNTQLGHELTRLESLGCVDRSPPDRQTRASIGEGITETGRAFLEYLERK